MANNTRMVQLALNKAEYDEKLGIIKRLGAGLEHTVSRIVPTRRIEWRDPIDQALSFPLFDDLRVVVRFLDDSDPHVKFELWNNRAALWKDSQFTLGIVRAVYDNLDTTLVIAEHVCERAGAEYLERFHGELARFGV